MATNHAAEVKMKRLNQLIHRKAIGAMKKGPHWLFAREKPVQKWRTRETPMTDDRKSPAPDKIEWKKGEQKKKPSCSFSL